MCLPPVSVRGRWIRVRFARDARARTGPGTAGRVRRVPPRHPREVRSLIVAATDERPHSWGGHTMDDTQARGRLLTPGEVAALFRVDPKTVTRWAAAGRISSIRTPGGHRRFRESEVRALLEGGRTEVAIPSQPQPGRTTSV